LKSEKIRQLLEAKDTACLVILDQFGVKYVDQDVFQFFSKCPTTDIMFFVSSSFVKRFAHDSSFNTRLPIQPNEIKETGIKHIHRKLCECYKSIVPPDTKYYLSHFSILKESNIYGVIFGSPSLLGLEKFLKVAWKMDPETGESNYDIDDDPIRKIRGQRFFLEEMSTYKKLDAFEEEVKNLLVSNSVDNLSLYQFCLEHGFLPRHVVDLLGKWQDDNILNVHNPKTGAIPKKGSYYIGWDYFKKNEQKLLFRIKE